MNHYLILALAGIWCASFAVVWGLCHAAKLSDIPPRPYKEWEQ